MKEMRGEVEKNFPKKEIDKPSFLWRHIADFLDTLSSYLAHPVSYLRCLKWFLLLLYKVRDINS